MNKILLLEKNNREESLLIKEYFKQINIEVVQIQTEDLHCAIHSKQIYYKNEIFPIHEFNSLYLRTYHQMDVVKFIASFFKEKLIFGFDPFSSHFQNNKLSDLIELSLSEVPIPNTYANSLPQDSSSLLIKDNWGYGGFGVNLYTGKEELNIYSSHIQEYITSKDSSDWRVLLINGKPVPCLIERFASEDDFRTNKHQGGSSIIHDTTHPLYKNLSQIAEKAGKSLDRNFAGVDLRVDLDGNIFVLEVNRTPRLRFNETLNNLYFNMLIKEVKTLLV